MFGMFVAGYLLLGVLVEIMEEVYVIKNTSKIFKIEPDEDTKFLDRFEGYNLEKLKLDIRSVLNWPIGLVHWLGGIKKFRNMNKEECEDLLLKYQEKFKNEGLL